MTDERFYYMEKMDSIIDIQKDKGYSPKSLEVLTNLLNTLHEENQKLKKLKIPYEEIQETIIDTQGRVIGIYYNKKMKKNKKNNNHKY